MLLHNDKELFREVVISTAEELGLRALVMVWGCLF